MANDLTIYKSKLFFFRGQSVMLDKDLAEFYGVELRVFNQAMKRQKENLQDETFQLTKEEYLEALEIQNLPPQKGYLPWAYSEKAAYKMAFILSSKTALKVADLIVEIFNLVREGKLVPKVLDNKILILEKRVETLELQMQGQKINNNFYAPVNMIQGNNNSITIGSTEELIMNLATLMANKDVAVNKELVSLLNKSIEQANKKDKKGLLETLKTIVEIGSSIATIGQNVPGIITAISKVFTF